MISKEFLIVHEDYIFKDYHFFEEAFPGFCEYVHKSYNTL